MDKLAPSRRARRQAALQRPRPDARIFGGEVSLLPTPLKLYSITLSARSRIRYGPIASTSTFQSDHDTDPRIFAFISLILHIDAHNDFRIFGARLRPFALNNFCLLEFSKEALHDYPP